MISNWNEAEFLEISSICGFDISSEDIEALSKRKLLSAWKGDVFGRAHLYLLAFYFDAITVHRHPWSVRNSESSLQDVKRLNNDISQLDPQSETVIDFEIAQECRTFFDGLDPFGPLHPIVDMLNAQTQSQLKNAGRLAYEIQLFLTQLEAGREPEEDVPVLETSRPSSVTFKLDAVERDALAVKPEVAPIKVEPDVPEAEENTRDTEEAQAITPTALADVDVHDELPSLVVDGPDGIDGDKTIPVSGAFHTRVDESAEMVLTDIAEDSVPEIVAPTLPESDGSLGLEESSLDMSTNQNEADNPFVPTEKTQALIARLNAVKTEDQKDLAEQIQALNVQRQTFISNQDWQGMADLYEDKINLFESNEERQEVLLTLASLHELKIKTPRRAITFFQLAIENGSINGLRKAYEGIQRVGNRPDLKAFCLSWLQERLNVETKEAEMPFLHLTNSNFLRECGKPHRAFLSYAAYLTRDPEKNVDETSLQNLESFAEKIEDSELESFYTDILDFENESLDYSSTRSLIAKRAGIFYKDRNPMLAVKYLRINLDKNPNEEESYLAISHIYQEEENWPDLIHLASKRYQNLQGQDRVRAGVQLEQFIAEDVNDDNAVDRYYEWAKLDPNSWAIEGVIAAITKSDRLAEGYALLQNLVGDVSKVEKKEKIYLSLANTALRQFESPQDAIAHYQTGLALSQEMSPQKAKLLEGLADLQIEAGKWELAIDALDKLTIGDVLPTEERIIWLNKGAQIAEQACIDSKLQLFKTRITEIESTP